MLGAPFSSLADVQHLLRSLSWYIAPLVLLKATCGLAGQYLALSARGATSTRSGRQQRAVKSIPIIPT